MVALLAIYQTGDGNDTGSDATGAIGAGVELSR